jgi:hypothetical protein
MTKQCKLSGIVGVVLLFCFFASNGQPQKELEFPLKKGILHRPDPYLSINEKNGIYISWTVDSLVRACDSGKVIHITHQRDSTFSVSVVKKNGLLITFHNMAGVNVVKNQQVQKGTVLGFLSGTSSLFIKVQNKRGLIDPYTVLIYRTGDN